MIDFPNSPTTGQIVTAPNGTAWRWSGSAWLLGSAASAAGARGQVAYAQITANIAGFGATTTDIAGLSVSFVAVAGRRYKITAEIFAGSAAASEAGSLNVATAAGAIVQTGTWHMVLGSSPIKMHEEVVVSPAAGAVTYKLQYLRPSGTTAHTIYADPQFPAYLLVEDITYDGGMTGPYPEAPAIAASISTASQAYSANVWTMASLTVKNWDNTGGFTLSGGKVIVPKAGVYEASLKVVQSVANAPQVVLAWGAGYGSSDTWFLDDSLAKDTHRVTGPLMTQAAAGGALEFWVYSRTVASTILITANIKRVAGAPA